MLPELLADMLEMTVHNLDLINIDYRFTTFLYLLYLILSNLLPKHVIVIDILMIKLNKFRVSQNDCNTFVSLPFGQF